jgi:hypothetical protein
MARARLPACRLEPSRVTELPDVTDPDIRAMVLRDHQPEERWTLDSKLISVDCDTCFGKWPCPSILAVRQVEKRMRDEPPF